jgi:hypothetical protein
MLYLLEQQSGEPTLVARDIRTGSPQWEQQLAISADPSEYIDMRVTPELVVLTEGATVYAYDQQTGEQQWQYTFTPIGDNPGLTLRSNGETMVITDEQEGITQNRLVGVDVESGDEVWNRTVSLPAPHKEAGLPSSIFDEGYVEFTTTTEFIILDMDTATGTINTRHEIAAAEAGLEQLGFARVQKWDGVTTIRMSYYNYPNSQESLLVYEELSGEPIFNVSSSSISGYPPLSNVYLQENGTVTGIEYPTETILWEKSTTWDNVVFYDQLYAFTSPDSGLATIKALDTATGDVRWSQSVAENRSRRLSHRIRNESIYVDDVGGAFYALDTETGEPRNWKINLSTDADRTGFRPLWEGEGVVITTYSYSQPEGAKLYMYPEPTTESGNGGGDMNTPPDVSLTTSSTTVQPDEQVTLDADATDPDGSDSALQYQWSITNEPEDANPPIPSGQQDEITLSAAGNYTYEVTVTDESGATAVATATITVTNTTDAGDSSVPEELDRFDQGNDDEIGNLDVLRAVNAANNNQEIGGEPVSNLDILQVVNQANE